VLSRKILVVEDSCHLRELLGKILASRGWEPILAESGREALAKLECQTPRVILAGYAITGYLRLWARDDSKKHPVYRNIAHSCGNRVGWRHSPAAVSFGRLR
jgi:CheY-like chemotaxis protein